MSKSLFAKFAVFLMVGTLTLRAWAQNGLPSEPAMLAPLNEEEASFPSDNADSSEGLAEKSDLGDIWNSSDVFGDRILNGTDVTSQIVIEQILEPEGDYRYAAFGKPDPFLPPYEILSGLAEYSTAGGNGAVGNPRTPSGEEIAIISPLQTDLENLTVIGMWQLDDGTRKALITNGASQAVAVEVGDPIGYTGRVTEIRPEGVIARQYTLRQDGSREYEDVLLLFGDKEELLKQHIGHRVLLSPGGKAEIKEVGPRVYGSQKAAIADAVNVPADRIPEENAKPFGDMPAVDSLNRDQGGKKANISQPQNSLLNENNIPQPIPPGNG